MATAAARAQRLRLAIRSQRTPKSSGSVPPDELLEQLVALCLRDRARSSRGSPAVLQELIELIASGGHLLLAMVLEPIVRAFETLPARNDGGEIGVLPLRMARRLLELADLPEEGFDEFVDAAVAVGVLRPVVRKQDGPARNRVDGLTSWDEIGIVLVGQGRGQVVGLQRLDERNGQDAIAIAGLEASERVRGF